MLVAGTVCQSPAFYFGKQAIGEIASHLLLIKLSKIFGSSEIDFTFVSANRIIH
ncbi:MAG: hypothetical protein MUC87_05850 [Bacteroidia bacterium]|jgi:hypothetical protein|nr:hypothetical protein [Bacteroidia bacterium]